MSMWRGLRVSAGSRRHRSAVVVVEKDGELPQWMNLPRSVKVDLNTEDSLWTHSAAGYDRVLVHSSKSRVEENSASVFASAVAVVKTLQASQVTTADVYFPQSFKAGKLHIETVAKWFNSSILSNYSYRRQTVPDPDTPHVEVSELNWADGDSSSAELRESAESAYAALYARDIGNHRGSDATPEYMQQCVFDLYNDSRKDRLDLDVISGGGLQTRGLHLLYNVGRGAIHSPRLLTLSYSGDLGSQQRLAIVGKCLTFDTGGLNLKPTGHIEDMYLDKAGACTALSVLRWAVATGFPVNLTVSLAVAENAVGDTVMKPGDIVKSLKGSTVEITNTDAEGRLALADALTYVQRVYRPDTIIDLATLTGACMVALGEQTAGLFTNNERLSSALIAAGAHVNETLWPLPITEEREEEMRGSTTDLVNDALEGRCGASQAAAFLQHFISPGTDWAHLDVAGPAAPTKPFSHFPAGASGFGTQLLIRYLYSRRK